MINCQKCGGQNEDDAKLCYRCYAPLRISQVPDKKTAPVVKQARENRSHIPRYLYIVIAIGIIICGLIIGMPLVKKSFHKAKVYEVTQQESDHSKETYDSVSALFKRMEEAIRKDEMVEVVKLYSKAFRDFFNNQTLQERIVILGSMKIGTAGFTECETSIQRINFENPEGIKAKVMTVSKCQNPGTGERKAIEWTWPIIKEEDDWKIDMAEFIKTFDESLKAK